MNYLGKDKLRNTESDLRNREKKIERSNFGFNVISDSKKIEKKMFQLFN
jgi:hypothetical protein